MVKTKAEEVICPHCGKAVIPELKFDCGFMLLVYQCCQVFQEISLKELPFALAGVR